MILLFPSVTSPASRTRASPPSPSAIARATALKRFEGLPMLCSHHQHAELECHHCYNRYWWCRWRWCWQLSGARDGSDDNEACLISHEAVLDLNHCSRAVLQYMYIFNINSNSMNFNPQTSHVVESKHEPAGSRPTREPAWDPYL